MLDEAALDLEWADPVSRGDDDVVAAPLVPVVTVRVSAREVVGQQPTVVEGRFRLFGTLPVLFHQCPLPGFDDDLADFVGPDWLSGFGVDEIDVEARGRSPHRAGFDIHIEPRVVVDDHSGFGEPVRVVDLEAEMLLEPLVDLGIQRIARTAQDPEGFEGPFGKYALAGSDDTPVRAGGGTQDRDVVFVEDPDPVIGIEPPSVK